MLAEKMTAADAAAALDELLSIEDAVSEPSATEGGRSHPNPHFARVVMKAPASGDAVRAVALRAAVELAGRSGRLKELQESVESALRDGPPPVRAEAVKLCDRWADLSGVDFYGLLSDEDAEIRARALAALGKRGELVADDEAVLACSEPTQPLAMRCTVLGIARENPQTFEATLRALERDPHVYLRAAARRALELADLGSGGQPAERRASSKPLARLVRRLLRAPGTRRRRRERLRDDPGR